MDEAGRISVEELLIHREWVARVARALVAGAAADDLEQRVWLRAMTHPPRHRRGLRGWLATLLRRGACDQRREDSRRRRREAIAAKPEATPSSEDLVARAETHRRVVSAVVALAEPYRSIVLLRWFEGLRPGEIAERRGIPVETVSTRLKRAHALLASRLDNAHGRDGRRWLAALLPLTGGAAGPGAILMSGKTILVIAAAAFLLLAGVATLFFAGRPDTPPPSPTPVAAEPPPRHAVVDPDPPPEVAPPGEVIESPPVPTAPAPSGATLSVRVVDASGIGILGAEVTLRRERPGATDLEGPNPETVGPVKTGEEGRAEFPGLGTGRYVVRGEAPGKAARDERVEVREEVARGPVLIVLLPAVELTGTVRGADGNPVGGVTVGTTGVGGFNTGADGKYRLIGLTPGPVLLSVRLSAGVEIFAGPVSVPEVGQFDVLLDLTGVVEGCVTEGRSGRPVAAAGVSVQVSGRDRTGTAARAEAVTGRDGTYRIGSLPPGLVSQVEARAEGYVVVTRQYSGTQPLVPGVPFREDFELSRGAVVRGRVTFDSGEPVPEAQVLLYGRRMRPHPEGRTGEDGTYVIRCVPAGAASIGVYAPGCWQPDFDGTSAIWNHEECSAGLVVPESGEVVKDVTLVKGGVVTGSVVDGDGAPLAGIELHAVPGGGHRSRGGRPRSDQEGNFQLEGVHPGEGKTVVAFDPRRVMSSRPAGVSDPFTLWPGEPATGVTVVVGRGVTLAGRVVDGDGTPVAGATVRLGHYAANRDRDPTDAALSSRFRFPSGPDGRFLLEGVLPGRVALAASAPGHVDGVGDAILVAQGERRADLVVVVHRERWAKGRVTDPEGRGLAGMVVRVASLADLRWSPRPGPVLAVSDRRGEFDLTGIGPGRQVVVAGRAGHGQAFAVLEADQSRVDLVLEPCLAISGMVTDRRSESPVAGIQVMAVPSFPDRELPREQSWTRTGPDGRFRLTGLRAGSYDLEVGCGWAARPADPEYVAEGNLKVMAGTGNVRIRLRPALAISGVVRDAEGRPVRGVRIYLRARSVRHHEVDTDHDGRFRLSRVPKGTYDLRICPPYRPGMREGLLETRVRRVRAGGDPVDVVLKLGRAISGRVVGPDGGPPPGGGDLRVAPAGARITGSSNPWSPVRLRADGTFSTRPLSTENTWDLRADDFPGADRSYVRGLSAGAEGVTVRVERGLTLSGTVVDEEGKPAAGVRISAYPDDRARRSLRPRDATSDASGRFLIDRLSDCDYRLRAGSGRDWEAVETVRARAGARDIELRSRRQSVFSGRVVDGAGKPVRCFVGWVQRYPRGGRRSSGTRTDNTGRFVIRELRPGPFTITLDLGARKIPLGEFTAPAEGVELTVK